MSLPDQPEKEIQPHDESSGGFLSEEMKQSFFGDLIYSMLQPGYIGNSSIVVINAAFFLFTLTVIWRLYISGFDNIENYAHAFALIPLIGLWGSINWYGTCIL